MKKTKTIILGTKEVVLSEISYNHILKLLHGDASIFALPLLTALRKAKDELFPLAFDVPLEELLAQDLYYEDLTTLYAALKETNPLFFETVASLNIDGALTGVLKAYITAFSASIVSSLPGTAPTLPRSEI